MLSHNVVTIIDFGGLEGYIGKISSKEPNHHSTSQQQDGKANPTPRSRLLFSVFGPFLKHLDTFLIIGPLATLLNSAQPTIVGLFDIPLSDINTG